MWRIVLKKSGDGDEVWSTIFRRAGAAPSHAGFGMGIGISFASLRRF